MNLLAERITQYLSAGGLFNPEHRDHEKVRDLLMDCRTTINALEEKLGTAQGENDASLAPFLQSKPCIHEWYQGACVHCEITASEFRKFLRMATVPTPL